MAEWRSKHLGLIYSKDWVLVAAISRDVVRNLSSLCFHSRSFSCPGLLALLPRESGSLLLLKCKAFEMLEIKH